jgi:hypothetical protein
MPMIDIYAAAGTFADVKKLGDAAALEIRRTGSGYSNVRKNTAAFMHEIGGRDLKRGRRQQLRQGSGADAQGHSTRQTGCSSVRYRLPSRQPRTIRTENAHVGAADRGQPRRLGPGDTPRPAKNL